MDLKSQTFELDVPRRELRVGGKQVKIQPKAFKLLQYLVDRPERAVSKHELMEALWPRLHVSETALTRCVMKARRAIGDKNTATSVIQTVHGHGYRFVPAKETMATTELVKEAPQKWSRASRWVFLLPAIVSALILSFFWFENGSPLSDRKVSSVVKLTILPIENATGREDLQWTELGLMSLVHEKIVRTPGMASVPPDAILTIIRNADESPEALLGLDPDIIRLLARLENSHIVVSSRIIADGNAFALEYLIYDEGVPSDVMVIAGIQPTNLGQDLAEALLDNFRTLPTNSPPESRISENALVMEAYAKGKMKLFEGDPEAARDFFESGLEFEPENFWLRHETALTLSLESRYQEASEILRPLLSDENASHHGRAEVYAALGFIDYKKGNSAEAFDKYLKYLDFAKKHGDSQLVASALVALGSVSVFDENYDQARDFYEQAVEISRQEESEHLPDNMLHSFGVLEARQHNFAAAEKYFEANLLRDRLTNDRTSIRVGVGNLARLRHQTGDYQGSTDYYAEALSLSRQQGSKNAVAFNLLRFSSLLIDMGRSDEAFVMLSEVIAYGEEAESKWVLDLALYHRARILLANGQIDAARADHERRLAELVPLKNESKVRSAKLDIANLDVDAKQPNLAKETVTRIINVARTENDKASQVKGLVVLGRALIALEYPVSATDALLRALDISMEESFKLETGNILCKLGNLHFDLGQIMASRRYLERARTMFPEHHCVVTLTTRHSRTVAISR